MQLHEQTRRFLALGTFYLLGPMLTLAVIGAVVLRKLPDNARRFEYALSVQTGLHWSIDSLEYRSPNTVRLCRVQLYDNDNTVFIAPQIDIGYVTGGKLNERFPGIMLNRSVKESAAKKQDFLQNFLQGFAGIFPSFEPESGYWQINLDTALIKLDAYSGETSAAAVQQILHKIVSRFEFLAETPVQISIEKLAAVSGYSSTKKGEKYDTFRFVQGSIYRTNDSFRSDWTFQIKGISETETEQLSFVRPLAGDTLEITLQTGKQGVPCGLAAVFCRAFEPFTGGDFSGRFSVTLNNTNPRSAAVRLDNVTLKNFGLIPLVKPYTRFAITGTVADLTIKHAVFGTSQFTAEGSVKIASGSLDTALFHRIVDNFRLTVVPSTIVESPRQPIPFTGCVVHFRLQPDGAVFWTDELWKNAFMYTENSKGEIVMTAYMPAGNKRQAVSYQAVLSIFAPDAAPVVPLTPGLQKIYSVIPAE
ncbi:MAG: hypothetical protein LBT89_01745 [Planctomycetaceae bacterium]|jgi:hypothetical protein|nr:hypothetical protein [Planctomycetaceae bacterium]